MENVSTLTVLAKFKVLSTGRVFLGGGGGVNTFICHNTDVWPE